jgi:hypothetical protein
LELWNKNSSGENIMIGNTEINLRDFENKTPKKV